MSSEIETVSNEWQVSRSDEEEKFLGDSESECSEEVAFSFSYLKKLWGIVSILDYSVRSHYYINVCESHTEIVRSGQELSSGAL